MTQLTVNQICRLFPWQKRCPNSIRGATDDQPRDTSKKPKSKRALCQTSETFDTQHRLVSGDTCPYRHLSYVWPARMDANCILFSDSICKFLKRCRNIDVYAYPGATISSLMHNIHNEHRHSMLKYSFVCLHVGTNDFQSHTAPQLYDKYSYLVNMVRAKHPLAVIVMSAILPRVAESSQELEKRGEFNCQMRKRCANDEHLECFSSWRAVIRNKEVVKEYCCGTTPKIRLYWRCNSNSLCC